MEKINIIVADDHNLVREGFCSLLKKNKDFNVIAEAKDGEELISLLSELQPHVVLIDVSMPKLNGIESLAIMQKKYPDVKAIVLTMHEEAEYAVKAIQNGAKGYLLKNTEPDELYQAIMTVASGGNYYIPTVSNVLLGNIASNKSSDEPLSEREKEVLKYVVKGLSAKMIADTLSISPRTVETHKINVMKKLKVANTAELITKAFQGKLV